MNVICSICSENLNQRDSIFYTKCGHVFHYDCLTAWLERSKSCPQCREKVTQNKIHRLYFTFSNNDVIETQGSTLQQKVDSLKFQILLKEKDIQYYSSKSINLEKQNIGLKQEVRKVESEMGKKNSTIYALKEQLNYFKEQNSECDNLKREIAQLKCKIEDLRPIQMLLHAPLCDVNKMVGNTKDHNTLTTYISIMKKELIASFDKCKRLRMAVKKLQKQHSSNTQMSDSTIEGDAIQMDLEERLAISESKNIALQKQIDELKEILCINEKCNGESEFQKTESQMNVSNENSQEKILTKDNQEVQSKDITLSHITKRKIHETPANSAKSVEEGHISEIGNTTNDFIADFENSGSSKNCPIVSKKLKLSEDNISAKSDKISNSISGKKGKHNVRKKVVKSNSGVIDLT